jgi:LacI family transcriptional regulator
MSTVSRVLSGTVAVSAAKRTAVEKAVAKLQFVPSPMARGLARGRSLTVGVVTQSLDSPYYGLALRGIEDEFHPTGYLPLFVSGRWNAAEEAKCIDALLARRVDGILVLTGRLADQKLRAYARRLPIVVTGRTLAAPGLFSLNFDNFAGGLTATQFLIEAGHKRIAFIGGDPAQPNASERQRGYHAALEAAAIAYDPALVMPGDFHEASGLLAVDRLLQGRQRFTAIFAGNDQMAYGAALGLRRRGLRVPDDVSLIGFDDLPGSQFAAPPLTSICHPAYELGRLAAQAMLQLLDGQPPTVTLPPPILAIRESTRRLPG